MNELNLYKLFKEILSKSKVIRGRFHVVPGYGNELNSNNVGEIIKDILGSITTADKYPLSLLMPPVEIIGDYTDTSFSRFRLEMYFLKKIGTDNGRTQSLNVNNNTSEHTVMQDWKDMRLCAISFRKALDYVLIKTKSLNKIRTVDSSKEVINRVSYANNDRLAGVSITFEVDVFIGCDMSDYANEALDSVTFPDADTHPQHKH